MSEPGVVSVLMYHSISEDPGPTSIAPPIFRMQLEELVATGVPVLPLAALVGDAPIPPRAVVITFDDGLVDFAETAVPMLRDFGFPVINFLPMARLGGRDDWGRSGNRRPRPILAPDRVVALAREGVAFGAHSLTHADLTALGAEECAREVTASGDALEELLGVPCEAFAAPYGAVNEAVLAVIRARYRVAVGTRLARVTARDDRLDLPRIEMLYYQDRKRWRAFLEHREEWYLRSRQVLRRVRRAAIDAARSARPR